ncbi:MAG TPA: hypothetical protein VFS43_20730 [Polyangiaceae bacterium]|nr:hypothetical protein [Polyangiaceae bacterium]
MVLFALVMAPSLAGAKPQLRTADPKWRFYQDIYHAAENYMELGRWEEALVRLDALLDKRVDTASVRFYRALCFANLKRWVEAYEDFGRAFAMGDPASPEDASIAKESYKKMAEVKKRLGWLHISVGPLPKVERPVLLIDGEPVPTEKDPELPSDGGAIWWAPRPVLRGEHTVEVRIPGREPLQKRVLVDSKEGDQTSRTPFPEPLTPVHFDLSQDTPKPNGAVLTPHASVTREASLPSQSRSTGGVTPYLGGAALALGVTSAGLSTAYFLDRAEGRGDALLVAGGITAGAAVASGVLALLLGGGPSDAKMDRGGPSSPAARAPSSLRGRVVVAPNPQGGGLIWAGSF